MIIDTESVGRTDMGTELPPLSVDTMSQVQLTEFIPQLICQVTGRQQPCFGKSQFKPEWWPEHIAWKSPKTENTNSLAAQITAPDLRDIVRSCYKHLGQESLLKGDILPHLAGPMVSPTVKNEKEEIKSSQDSIVAESRGESQESVEDPIWVCFLCAKQFCNQDELMTHQDLCEEEEEKEPQKSPPKPDPPARRYLHPQRNLQPSHIVIQPRPVQLLYRRRKKFPPEPYKPPPKEEFIKALYMSDTPKEPLRSATPVTDIDSDCEIIDVTYDESAAKTARTPKSLMSQLSHSNEHSARKRHLSFSQELNLPEEYSSEDSDSESEYIKPKNKVPFGTRLCNIDLSSPLGLRVKKHCKVDTNYSIVPGDKIESFCCGPLKNNFVEKLRHKGESNYPIVFNKKNRKHMGKYRHEFKFTAGQRQEFMLRLKTGLTKRSRRLLKDLVRCSVKLERLKPGVIRKWLRPKPPPPYPYAYIRRMFEQEHPIIKRLVQKPVFGPKYAKLKQISDGLRKLNRPNNLLPNQRVVTKVVQNADGSTGMRMIMAHPDQRPNINNMSNNRRKQTFDQSSVRKGEIEIIELSSSSDEEGDTSSKPTHPTPQPSQGSSQPKQMTHFKNITGVQQNQVQRPSINSLLSQKLAAQQGMSGNPSKITYYPKEEVHASKTPSPNTCNNTRARIFQGVRGILSPSSLPNKPEHSQSSIGSTCKYKEMMQSTKPMIGKTLFKDASQIPQILRNSQNSPQKPRTLPSSFPGYVPSQTIVSSGSAKSASTILKTRETNGSPVVAYPAVQTGQGNRIQNSALSKPPVMQVKPRDPIMESEVIVIDDE